LEGDISAAADELRVASGGAAKEPVSQLAERFSRQTGHFVRLEFAPMGTLAQRLAARERFDVLVMTPEALAAQDRDGRVVGDSAAPLGRVGIGIAVAAGAPVPDLSSPVAIRQLLLGAKSIVYVDPALGTSGRYVADMIARLGIADEVRARTTLGSGGQVVEPVGRGEIEIGIHQISEILPVKGVRLVGELPPEFQHYTLYVAAVPAASDHQAAARLLINRLSSGAARQKFIAAGLRSP